MPTTSSQRAPGDASEEEAETADRVKWSLEAWEESSESEGEGDDDADGGRELQAGDRLSRRSSRSSRRSVMSLMSRTSDVYRMQSSRLAREAVDAAIRQGTVPLEEDSDDEAQDGDGHAAYRYDAGRREELQRRRSSQMEALQSERARAAQLARQAVAVLARRNTSGAPFFADDEDGGEARNGNDADDEGDEEDHDVRLYLEQGADQFEEAGEGFEDGDENVGDDGSADDVEEFVVEVVTVQLESPQAEDEGSDRSSVLDDDETQDEAEEAEAEEEVPEPSAPVSAAPAAAAAAAAAGASAAVGAASKTASRLSRRLSRGLKVTSAAVARRMSAVSVSGVSPEFRRAGTRAGLEMWRVERKRSGRLGLTQIRRDEVGTFFDMESCLVLNSQYPIKDSRSGVHDRSKALCHTLHFWVGANTSKEEMDVAFSKAFELSSCINGKPVPHREVQGHESRLFLSCFQEIIYLNGKCKEAGFRNFAPYEPRLLMVRHEDPLTRAMTVPVHASSMNHGDAFILDAGSRVFRWVGSDANAFEKTRSALLQSNIVSSRHGKAVKVDPELEAEDFWDLLQGSVDDVRDKDDPYHLDLAAPLGGADPGSVRVFRISDESGALEFSLEAEGHVETSVLDSDDVFLIETDVDLWVWLGAGSTLQEQSSALRMAEEYIASQGLPNTMTITFLTEEQAQDNDLFLRLFLDGRP